MEEYLSVGLCAADRLKKIIELIQQGPPRGLITVALHEGGNRESSSRFIRPYQRSTDPEQIATVARSVDRYIAGAYERGDRRYDGATVTVFDRPRPVAPE